MTTKYQGETIKYEFTITNEDGSAAVLTGATAQLGTKSSTGAITTKAGTIVGNVVSATLTATETSTLLGDYTVEFKLKTSDGTVRVLLRETMKIAASVMPGF